MITVHKFGGGILRAAADYQTAAGLLSENPSGKVAVVSARFGMTDRLSDILNQLSEDEEKIDSFTHQIVEDHLKLLEPIQNQSVQKKAARKILDHCSKLNKILYGAKLLQEISPRTRDLVLSFGERLSAHVLWAHLSDRGGQTVVFEADEAGLITDNKFGNALPDFNATQSALRKTVLPVASSE